MTSLLSSFMNSSGLIQGFDNYMKVCDKAKTMNKVDAIKMTSSLHLLGTRQKIDIVSKSE